jgi:hypothetical protein
VGEAGFQFEQDHPFPEKSPAIPASEGFYGTTNARLPDNPEWNLPKTLLWIMFRTKSSWLSGIFAHGV